MFRGQEAVQARKISVFRGGGVSADPKTTSIFCEVLGGHGRNDARWMMLQPCASGASTPPSPPMGVDDAHCGGGARAEKGGG